MINTGQASSYQTCPCKIFQTSTVLAHLIRGKYFLKYYPIVQGMYLLLKQPYISTLRQRTVSLALGQSTKTGFHFGSADNFVH